MLCWHRLPSRWWGKVRSALPGFGYRAFGCWARASLCRGHADGEVCQCAACAPETAWSIRMKAAALLAVVCKHGYPAIDQGQNSPWHSLLPELLKLGSQGPVHMQMVSTCFDREAMTQLVICEAHGSPQGDHGQVTCQCLFRLTSACMLLSMHLCRH